MRSRSFSLACCLATIILLGMACGSVNVNRYLFVTGSNEEKSLDYLIERARYEYDQGNFDKAMDLVNSALDLSPGNEEATILGGYVNLSMSGIDPFALARKLIESDTKAKSTTSGTKLTATTTSGGNSADLFTTLSSLLNLSDEDRAKLETKKDTSVELYPVPIPACAEDARSISTLEHLNKAIDLVCPFVDASAKITGANGDSRHTTDHCKTTVENRRLPVKAHFLWAFTHLTEALVFQSVLLYTESSTTAAATTAASSATTQASNLQKRVDSIKAGSTADVSQAVTQITNIKTLVDQILPVGNSNDCTKAGKTPQFWATLNDMRAVGKAFNTIQGIPDSVKNQVTAAMDKIEQLGKITDQATALQQQEINLKAQLNKKLANSISSKITDISTTHTDAASQAQVKQLCTQFDDITGYSSGALTDQQKKDLNRPASCG